MSNVDEAIRLKEVHDSLVNERHGIITRLVEQNELPDVPGLHIFNALTLRPAFFCRNAPALSQETAAGSGAHFRRSAAMWSAFGEVAERYCGSIYFRDDLVTASAEELNGSAVALPDFILFSDRQYAEPGFPFGPPDSKLKRRWVKARDLRAGTERLVPAQAVFLGLDLIERREELVQSNSTGLACGTNFEAAARAGLCEVVERDAFASLWQLGITPVRLVVEDDLAERLQPEVLRHLQEGPLRLHLWSLVTDVGVPVILAAAESPRERIFTIGASCHLDAAKAVNKAVVEALHGFVWGRSKLQCGETISAETQIKSPQDHLSFYLDPKNRTRAEFLFAEGPSAGSGSLPEDITDLESLVARLGELGYSALVADVTTRDIADLGLCVTRALVPGLQPLLFGSRIRTLDERRLRRMASHWRSPFPPEANPAPHPFP